METVSIGEVARQTGLSQSAIRYYEAEGLVLPPGRRGGWRLYPQDTIDRLQAIRMARELGFSLDDIRTLVYDCLVYDCNPPVQLTPSRSRIDVLPGA